MGKEEAKNRIKRNLWMRGYRVKDVFWLTGTYDLLVNQKYRVFVGYISSAKDWEISELVTETDCDVAAIFIPGKKGERPIIAYSRERRNKIVGLVKRLNQFVSFTRKPQEVFK
jgi:hypothetical protein